MSRYNSNYGSHDQLQDLRKHCMQIERQLANEQALTMGLTNQIADLKVQCNELQDELNLAHEALRRAYEPQ